MYVHNVLHRRPKYWFQNSEQLQLCKQNGQGYQKTDNPLPINGACNDMSFDRYGPQPDQLHRPPGFILGDQQGQQHTASEQNDAEHHAAAQQGRKTLDQPRALAE
jgi:hypothetical protein